MNRDKIEQAVRLMLEGFELDRGDEFSTRELERTPARVTRAWVDELLSGYATDPEQLLTWSPAPAGGGTVLVRDVRFASVCVHHLLPFSGRAHVAYLPDERLAGLSKIGRVIDAHARRLQTQEHLAAAIVRTLDRALAPRGVLAVLEAEHTCMTLRGVRKEGSAMSTVAASGLYDSDRDARREVVELLGAGRGSG